jgi:hypothetical protein
MSLLRSGPLGIDRAITLECNDHFNIHFKNNRERERREK